jgi:hypothetical protein
LNRKEMVMADPVIIDDGGSTRIKRVLPGTGVGEMDSLLNVKVFTPPRRGSNDSVNDTFTSVMIVCQDKTGNPFTLTVGLTGDVEIASALGQNVSARMNGSKLDLTVFSDTSEPIVEAKQHGGKRRYVVSNSGPIETVKVNGTLVLDTRPGGLLPAGASRPILYTSVVLS